MMEPFDGMGLLGAAMTDERIQSLVAPWGGLKGVTRRGGGEGHAIYPNQGVKLLFTCGKLDKIDVYLNPCDDCQAVAFRLQCGLTGDLSRDQVRAKLGRTPDIVDEAEPFGDKMMPACDVYDYAGGRRLCIEYSDDLRPTRVSFSIPD